MKYDNAVLSRTGAVYFAKTGEIGMRIAALKVASCLITAFGLVGCGDGKNEVKGQVKNEGANVQWVYAGTFSCPGKEWDEFKKDKTNLSPYCAMAGKVYAGEIRCKDSRGQVKCE